MRKLSLWAGLAALCLSTSPVSAQTEAVEAAQAYRQAHEHEILEETLTLLRLPNNAANRDDILVNARLLVAMLEARGATAQILEAGDASPAVFGEIRTPGATRTLMLYTHYDGQPVDLAAWATDPFDPVIRAGRLEDDAPIVELTPGMAIDPDWRIYGRSSSDDKSPTVAILRAIDALRDAGLGPRVNIKFFIEGEEEAGSAHLSELLEAHRDLLDADLWLIADGPIDTRGDPRMVLGVRGVTSLQLTLHGASRVLHSGHYGNVAPNPAARLAHLIASMREPGGHVLIDGFYDEVTPVSDAARGFIADGAFDEDSLLREPGIARTEYGPGAPYGEAVMVPALNILGLSAGATGAGTRNAVPETATAAIGFRVVPGMTMEHLRRVFTAHVESQGYVILDHVPSAQERLDYPMIAQISWSPAGYEAAGTDPTDPMITHLLALMRAAESRPLRVVPLLGGSLPLASISGVTHTPFAIVPIVNPDNSQHGPNENLRIGNLWSGIDTYAAILASDWEPVEN